jgi:biopolymer transport protein ExbD
MDLLDSDGATFRAANMRIPTSRQRATQVDMQTAMTPLIDVVFQLLIFFICASTGHMKELLLLTDFRAGAVGAATLPELEQPLGEVSIRLKRVDEVTVAFLEGREFPDLEQLGATLRALANAATDIPVTLEIGSEVTMGDVIYVYDVCRSAKFQSVNFAVTKSGSGTKSD